MATTVSLFCWQAWDASSAYGLHHRRSAPWCMLSPLAGLRQVTLCCSLHSPFAAVCGDFSSRAARLSGSAWHWVKAVPLWH